MKTLLRIDASSRVDGSHSRKIGNLCVEQWLKTYPDAKVQIRDLSKDQIPHIQENTIGGFFTSKEEHTTELKTATELSDTLISELKAADAILINTPMYNFSIPSALKAWIDQISRIGETFSYSPEEGFAGLLENKKAYVVTSTGAVFDNDEMKTMDFMTPYLRSILTFLGISDIQFLTIEGSSGDEIALEKSTQAAINHINHLWS